MENYLSSCGLTPQEIEAIRRNLMRPSALEQLKVQLKERSSAAAAGGGGGPYGSAMSQVKASLEDREAARRAAAAATAPPAGPGEL